MADEAGRYPSLCVTEGYTMAGDFRKFRLLSNLEVADEAGSQIYRSNKEAHRKWMFLRMFQKEEEEKK